MKIEKNDMVMVYDGGGTVPHCKYTGRFGDLTAYWHGWNTRQTATRRFTDT